MGLAINPVIIWLHTRGTGRIDVDVKAWKVHVSIPAGEKGLVEGAAPTVGGYKETLGGLFDGHGRPVLVMKTFELQTDGTTPMQGSITVENLVEGEWPVP